MFCMYVCWFELNMKRMSERLAYFSIVVGRSLCESKQEGQAYRHFILFLTPKRQREREEKCFLACLPHTNIQRATFIVQRKVQGKQQQQQLIRYSFLFSPIARRAMHKDKRKSERGKTNRWKRNDVVTVVCQLGKIMNTLFHFS